MASRTSSISTLVVAGLFVAMQHASVAGQQAHEDEMPAAPVTARVRTGDAKLAALIQQARDGSRTFRQMVSAIELTDGVIYVDRGRCIHGSRACLTWVTALRGHRILHVLVDDRRSDIVTMAALGHELRHGLEVLGDTTVTSRHAMYYFYQREGFIRNHAFETLAAITAEETVLRELRKR